MPQRTPTESAPSSVRNTTYPSSSVSSDAEALTLPEAEEEEEEEEDDDDADDDEDEEEEDEEEEEEEEEEEADEEDGMSLPLRGPEAAICLTARSGLRTDRAFGSSC